MSEFRITLSETIYAGLPKQETVTADRFEVVKDIDTEPHATNKQAGDLNLIKDGEMVASYKSERWVDVKLVSGENDV